MIIMLSIYIVGVFLAAAIYGFIDGDGEMATLVLWCLFWPLAVLSVAGGIISAWVRR